jgi:hypothetical protein
MSTFKNNSYVGLLLFLGILLDRVVNWNTTNQERLPRRSLETPGKTLLELSIKIYSLYQVPMVIGQIKGTVLPVNNGVIPVPPSLVIPVSSTGIQFSIKMVHFNITFMLTYLIKFLDSSVTRWNDNICCKNKYSFINYNELEIFKKFTRQKKKTIKPRGS